MIQRADVVERQLVARGMFEDLFGLGAHVLEHDDPLLDALEELTRDPAQVDPLRRLFDETFTETVWEYEGSRLDSPFLPGSLHQKQREALQAEQRFKWLFWGNQVGKTTLGAVETVLYALGRHPRQLSGEFPMPGVTFWASALTWELWEDILLPELLTWIPPDRVLDAPEPYKKSTKRTIVLRADNGKLSRITGKAAEQGAARYQSRRLHGAWLDEEHPEAIYDELQPRLLRFGGVIINTMTPLKGLTWTFHRVYEPWKRQAPEAAQHYVSHAGLEDNPGIPRASIEQMKTELRHNPAQLAARLHGFFMKPSGRVLDFREDRNVVALTHKQVHELLRARRVRVFAGVDFGAWRFAFTLWVTDDAGRLHLIDELFLQRGSYGDERDPKTGQITKPGRARRIHECLFGWGVSTDHFLGVGDCANPQDILELNRALMEIESPYRFGAVHANHKIIAAGVERLQAMLGAGDLLVRKGLGAGQVWYLGQKAGVQGKPVEGSRWLWEIDNWLYPKTDDEKAQKDAPDDNTADGADMMAASRYVVMTYFAADPAPAERRHPTVAEREWANQRGEELPDIDPEFTETEDHWDMVQEG